MQLRRKALDLVRSVQDLILGAPVKDLILKPETFAFKIKCMTTKINEVLEAETAEQVRAETYQYEKLREHLRDQFTSSDEIEVDDDALVSIGAEDGCYVQAWHFIRYDDVEGYDHSKLNEQEN